MSVDPTSVAPLAVTFEALTEPAFWIGVGVIAGIYTLLALGLQVNVGFTGIVNFGQAAFMAVGDVAHDYGRFQIAGETDGTPWGPSFGKYVVVWRRGADGQWRMYLDMWNRGPQVGG